MKVHITWGVGPDICLESDEETPALLLEGPPKERVSIEMTKGQAKKLIKELQIAVGYIDGLEADLLLNK